MDTTTPVQKPTTPNTPNCNGVGCADCLKGGIPFRKEWISFFLILFIITSTVLSVLYVNAKREAKSAASVPAEQMVEKGAAIVYPSTKPRTYTSVVKLPKPVTEGSLSLEEAIVSRRSRREFSDTPVTIPEISQMLWSGQGQTDPSGKRTIPSARESYSMTLFVFVKEAKGLTPGIYEYIPKDHSLGAVSTVDVETAMKTAGAQAGAQAAPVVFLIASDFGLYQTKTKAENMNATYMEAGHISQNMYLMAESLKMGTVTMAGFSSPKMVETLKLDPAFNVEYIMPFGHRAVATGSATVTE